LHAAHVEQWRPISSARADGFLIFDLFGVWKSKRGGVLLFFRAEQQKFKIRLSTASGGELDI